jgi:hypothetical protein
MRIRKLAKDLETDETALFALLTRLGHGRYTDAEQQLPATIEAQVRRHARDLPKLGPAPTLPPQRTRPAAEAVVEPDRAFFERAMAQVRPLATVSAPAAAAAPKAQRPPAKASPVATPARVEARPEKPVAPPVDPRIAQAEGRAAEAEARALAAEAGRSAAEQRLAEAEARAASLEAALTEVDQHRRQLQRESAVQARPETGSLRGCFERRGLRGEDEISGAIRALVDAHRVGELIRLELADPGGAEDMLWERLLLLGEDEPAPPGVVAVRVPADRSEGQYASVNRAAMSRFSTACLVHNRKRIVIVGGSPAYHRILREGLDPRLDVRLIPGNRRGRLPEIPTADLVILWASTILDHSVSAQFAEGVVIPHRGIARMLTAATEWIEGRR